MAQIQCQNSEGKVLRPPDGGQRALVPSQVYQSSFDHLLVIMFLLSLSLINHLLRGFMFAQTTGLVHKITNIYAIYCQLFPHNLTTKFPESDEISQNLLKNITQKPPECNPLEELRAETY